MKRLMLTAMVCGLCWANLGQAAEQEEAAIEREPQIQMAILLDTSSSMSGLIEQAKTQLWTIVNEFATSRQGGRVPMLEVALYEYGKSSLAQEEDYLRMIVGLTTDLDKVSQELFALTTNGGAEYCGAVIRAAVGGLKWSESGEDFKVIFIAGTEPFTQGKVDYREACKAAVERGIIVNTIHCGGEQQGIEGKWRDGALLADGQYMQIDQNREAVYVAAPQDAEIARLGEALNGTYIAFGALGDASAMNQAAQDTNAANSSPKSAVQRAVTKASVQYRNSGWDLVDAVREEQVELKEIDEESLPEEMRELDMAGREAYVAQKQQEREEIQKQIQALNGQRRAHVAAEMKKLADQGADTLEAVIIRAIREQATQKNFTFVPETPVEEPGEEATP